MQNVLIRGNPGTGKTFVARAMAYYVCQKGIDIDQIFEQDFSADYQEIEEFVTSKRCEFVQVHPSVNYDDIVYGVEIRAEGAMNFNYTDKRVKLICSRAACSEDAFCIIFDDITRTNAEALLGNLLYALEYRGQPVTLPNGDCLTIPDNVLVIITECNQCTGNTLGYSVLRRINHVIDLKPSRDIIGKHYQSFVPDAIRDTIFQIFDTTVSFITRNAADGLLGGASSILPGHGLFMVDKSGIAEQVLDKFQQKLRFQLFPYLAELKMNGFLRGDIDILFKGILAGLAAGETAVNRIAGIEKILINANKPVNVFSLEDSRSYFADRIIPDECREHRAILECVIDALLLNGAFSPDDVMSAFLLNTEIGCISSETDSTDYASYLVNKSIAERYNYVTPRDGKRVSHAFYSTNPTRHGRWGDENDSVGYRLIYKGLWERRPKLH